MTKPITDETITNYADSIIETVDQDFRMDHLAQAIVDLTGIKESASWNIGDMSFFGRIRMDKEKEPVYSEPLNGDEQAALAHCLEFADRRYGKQPPMSRLKLLDWDIYLYSSFWVLQGTKNVKIWQIRPNFGANEDGFNHWLMEIASSMGWSQSKWKSLGNMYRTSGVWARPMRMADQPWSVHYELTNLVGPTIDASVQGIPRIAAKQDEVIKALALLEETGPVTLNRVLYQKQLAKRKRMGWKWELPFVERLQITDLGTNATYTVIEFVDMTDPNLYDPEVFYVQANIVRSAGIFTRAGDNYNLVQKGDKVCLPDGRLVGRLKNMDKPLVEAAILSIAEKMNWGMG